MEECVQTTLAATLVFLIFFSPAQAECRIYSDGRDWFRDCSDGSRYIRRCTQSGYYWVRIDESYDEDHEGS